MEVVFSFFCSFSSQLERAVQRPRGTAAAQQEGQCRSLAALGRCKHTLMPVLVLSGRQSVVYTCPPSEERRGVEGISYSIFLYRAFDSCFLVRIAFKHDPLFLPHSYLHCKVRSFIYGCRVAKSP